MQLTGQAGGPAFIVVKGISNIERRILNFEVTERKKDPESTLWVSFIFFFFFSLQNSKFSVQYSSFKKGGPAPVTPP
ncbi:MAG: hypothetical protein K8R91_05075 [Phycisphaerae bacterium]|nr:hypothetical protein [Phycisphaerae bacterium]